MECPICANPNAQKTSSDTAGNEVHIRCLWCGNYAVTEDFLTSKPKVILSKTQKGNARGWIYDHPGVKLDKSSWGSLLSLSTPSVGEKADKLLLYFAKKHPVPNQPLDYVNGQQQNLAACWAANEKEFDYLVKSYLFIHKGYIKNESSGLFLIAPQGWDYLHSLFQTNAESGIGFCAMWFDASVTSLWDNGIAPAISDAGYKPMRMDKHEHNNRIDDEIIAMIKRSKFVVSDLTGRSGGVYFEAGYALGMGIPVIWSVRHDQLDSVHFDNRQYSFLQWEDGKFDDFRSKLRFRIEATIGRGPIPS